MYLKNEQYFIGNRTVLSLAKEFGTPLYVYDAGKIRQQINNLKQHLHFGNGTEFLYAAKANANPFIIQEIIKEGFGVDAVSIEEVKLGLHCGASPKKIMFTENNCTDDEMRETHDLDVLMNIGSLSRLEKFGKSYPGERLCVRLNPEVGGAASHETNITVSPYSKFGTSIRYIPEIKNVATKYGLKIIGLHQHVGSGWLSAEEPLKALEIFLREAVHFPDLEFLDLGGGFGVPYRSGESQLNLQDLARSMAEKLNAFFELYGRTLSIRFEPGRYVIAEAGHLLAEVNTLKQVAEGSIIAGTNTGMNHLVRVAMYGSYHPITNISNPSGELKTYDITGNVCESADFFAKGRHISEIRESDILSIDIAGAYGMSMATNYQFRSLPAEVLVDGDIVRLIRPRQKFDEMLRVFSS